MLRIEAIPTLAGVERVTYVLTQYFLKKGIRVMYLYYGIREVSDDKCHRGIDVFFLPKSDLLHKENFEYLNRIVKEEHCDFVINQGGAASDITLLLKGIKSSSCGVITTLHGKPYHFSLFNKIFVNSVRNLPPTFKKFLKLKFPLIFSLIHFCRYRNALRWTLISSDYLIVLSHRYILPLVNLLGKNALPKLKVIPNPLSFEGSYENCFKKKQVLYVGRLEYSAKRIDRLITAWSLIENRVDWKLVIVGGDSGDENEREQRIELSRLMKMAGDLELTNVEFVGRQDPKLYYEESQVLCLTSTYEGFPMVLGEAMQHGVVPIAFGSFESIFDIIDNEINGLVIQPFDIEEFARQLERVMNEDELREMLSRNAIKKSEQFSINSVGDTWSSLFEELRVDQ